ncbi:MAG: archease [Elusimicrobiota bacterium]
MGRFKIKAINDIEIELISSNYIDVFKTLIKVFNYLVARPKKKTIMKQLSIKYENYESLIIDFFNELIYLFETENFLPLSGDFKIEKNCLIAKLKGGILGAKQHVRYVLKSATHHNFVFNEGKKIFVKFLVDI